ncbi:hypothetical protein Tco_0945332, partial [Tanacetum coccineum]
YNCPAKTRLLAAVEATALTMVLLDYLEGINYVGFSSRIGTVLKNLNAEAPTRTMSWEDIVRWSGP